MSAVSATRNHYRRGVELGLSEDYHQAIIELAQAVQKEPGFVKAHVSLGVALHKASQDDRALESYNTALNLSPEHAEALFFRANIYHIRQQMPQAIAGYTIAIGLNPALINAYRKRPLKRRLTDYTRWPVEMYWIAKPARAILECNKSMKTDSQNTGALRRRGAAYYELWNYERAAADFVSYLEIKPDDVQVVHWRGLSYEQLGQFDLAVADYTRALELNPNFSSSYYINRGVTYGKMGDLHRSLADLQEGIRLDPHNPKGYYNRGMTCYLLKNFDQAIKDLSQVISLSPSDAEAYRFRARVYEQTGMPRQAIKDYEAFLQLSHIPQERADVKQRIASMQSQEQDQVEIMVNQTEHAPEKLVVVLRNGSCEERCSAAETLGNLGDRCAVQPLIRVVSNRFGDDCNHPDYRELRDWMVRAKAAKALGKLGDERAIEPLIEAFKDRSGHVCGAAIRAFGQIGEPALGYLLDALKNTDCAVRIGAVSALGWLGGQRSFKAILTMLQDPEPLVSNYAINALFQCGGTKTVELLLAALRRDENSRIAASVLAAVSDDCATQFLEQAKHQHTDKVDPELTIAVLEIRLCAFAGAFRGSSDLSEQERIVHEYHAVMNKLYFLGWNGGIDLECELPEEFMPEEYLQRYPDFPAMSGRCQGSDKEPEKQP